MPPQLLNQRIEKLDLCALFDPLLAAKQAVLSDGIHRPETHSEQQQTDEALASLGSFHHKC
jgi:hypothetical protein